MQKLTALDIVAATGGRLVQGQENAEITNITRDSRTVNDGSLFVPLKGEKADGHDFIDKATAMGAAAVITSRAYTGSTNVAVIEVSDTLTALGDIARYYKSRQNVLTLAVTGSVGKTTTKDIISSALSAEKRVQKTDENYNNNIGVPETIFTIEPEHEIAVIEMGMNHFDEIDYLASVAMPDAAVITNIGVSHIENLGSREGIFKAKMEITNRFDESNTLIVNGDDDYLGTVKHMGTLKCKVVSYGITNPENDITAYDIVNHGLCGTEFKTRVCNREYKIYVPLAGQHNVYNALAAICAACEFGVDISAAIRGIENTRLTGNRFEIVKLDTKTIVRDYYNASPDSITSALNTLSYAEGKKAAILGDVLELGDIAKEAHYKLGKEVVKNKVDLLITAGENARQIAVCAHDMGMENVFSFDTTDEAAEFVKTADLDGYSVLIKASHGMNFEKIYTAITEK